MTERHDLPENRIFFSSWRRTPHALRPRGKRTALRIVTLAFLGLVGGIITLALLGAGGIAWRLSSGPIPLPWLTQRVEKDLGKRLGNGYTVALGETALESSDGGARFTVAGLVLKDPQGRTVIDVPKASVAIDAAALVSGNVSARRLELYDLDVWLAFKANGALVVSAGTENSPGLEFVVPVRRGE